MLVDFNMNEIKWKIRLSYWDWILLSTVESENMPSPVCTVFMTHISVPASIALNSLKLNLNDWIKALRRTNRVDYLGEKSSLSTSLNHLVSNCISPQSGFHGPFLVWIGLLPVSLLLFQLDLIVINIVCSGKSHLKSY